MLAELKVAPDHERMRLDVFVSTTLGAEYTRSHVARMIKAGLVSVNGAPSSRPSSPVHAGDSVAVAEPPASEPPEISSNAPPIEVLHADAEIIVVNKPAGMTVHPAPGHHDGTLVDALLARFPELATMAEAGGVLRPGIVHRLDKDTSGVMVVARTPFAKASLSAQFKARTVKKVYVAIVRGIVARDQLTIAQAIGRHPTERKKMSIHSHTPREAVSNVTVIARMREPTPSTLAMVLPETGRTHQIRVHLASIGHPCLGEALYGGKQVGEFPRHALHAMELSIDHPRTHERRTFVAPLPDDFRDFLASHGVDFQQLRIGDELLRR